MNTSNKLTLLRIILVVPLITLFCIYFWYEKCVDSFSARYFLYGCGAIFIVSMITDFVDGWLARKNNQVTSFGKLFDPLADKIIVTTVLIFLCVAQYTYLIVVILFIIRDLVVDGSRNVAAKHDLKVEASICGKIKTLLQTFAIIILIFACPSIDMKTWYIKFSVNIPMFLALIASLLSGFLYFKKILPIVMKDK